MGLSCRTEAVPGGPHKLRLALAGELDYHTAAVLHTAVTAALQGRGSSDLLVDLGETTFCDAAGITALLRARQYATDRHAGFSVTRAHGLVRRVLVLADVLDALAGTTGVLRTQPDSDPETSEDP